MLWDGKDAETYEIQDSVANGIRLRANSSNRESRVSLEGAKSASSAWNGLPPEGGAAFNETRGSMVSGFSGDSSLKFEYPKTEHQMPRYCYFIFKTGSIDFKTPPSYKWPVKTLEAGHFIGDFPSIIAGKGIETEATCIEDCELIRVASSDLAQFLKKNPGLKLLMREEYIIY